MKGKLSDLFLSSKESVIIKPDLAVKLGLNEAIVLRQIYYWLEINEKLEIIMMEDIGLLTRWKNGKRIISHGGLQKL